MAVGSIWCSRNGRIKAYEITVNNALQTELLHLLNTLVNNSNLSLTFPKIGISTLPHVSAAQCTKPLMKSAVMMPRTKTRSQGLIAHMIYLYISFAITCYHIIVY